MNDPNTFDIINFLIQLKIVTAFHLYRRMMTFIRYHPMLYHNSFQHEQQLSKPDAINFLTISI